MDLYFFDDLDEDYKDNQNQNEFNEPDPKIDYSKDIDFIKGKIQNLHDLSDKGELDDFDKELQTIKSYKLYAPEIFKQKFQKIDFKDLEKTCFVNHELNKLSTKTADSLSDLVGILNEVDTIEIKSAYSPSYNKIKQRIIEVSKTIEQNYVDDIVTDTLKQLYILSDKNDFHDYQNLKKKVTSQINLAKEYGVDLTKILEKVKPFEDNEKFLFSTLDHFDVTNKNYDSKKINEYFKTLDDTQTKIITQFSKYYQKFIVAKKEVLQQNITHHLTNGFNYAQQLNEKKMNEELDTAKKVINYSKLGDSSNILIIENVYHKEQCDNILSNLNYEVKNIDCEDATFFTLSSQFKSHMEELKTQMLTKNDVDYIKTKEKKYDEIRKTFKENMFAKKFY